MNPAQPDAITAFDDVKRDAYGVSPTELHRFLRDRLSEPDARETAFAVSRGNLTPGQLANRLGLPSDAVTDIDVTRLRHLLSLWQRWAMDDAHGWLTIGTSHRGVAAQ